MLKKIILIIPILLSIIFNIQQVQAGEYTFTEDFSTIVYKDSVNTVAYWDINQKRVQFPCFIIRKNTSPRIDLNRSVNAGNQDEVYIVWRSANEIEAGSGHGDIYVQKLKNGRKEWDSDVKVNSDIFLSGDKSAPNIAVVKADFNNKAAIVWWDRGADLPAGSTTTDARNNFAISRRLCSARNPAVAVSDMYSYIAWEDYRGFREEESFNIYLRKFDENKKRVWTGAIKVNTIVDGDQINPDIAIDDFEDIYITWQGPKGIYVQKYNKNGERFWKEDIKVDASGANPAIAVNRFSGDIHIVYSKKQNDKWNNANQKFDTNGNSLGEIHIRKTGSVSSGYPRIDIDGSGNIYILGQENNGNLYIQNLNPSGFHSKWNQDIIINDHISEKINNVLYTPDIAIDLFGNIYASRIDEKYNIYVDKYVNQVKLWSEKVNQDFYQIPIVVQSTKINTGSEDIFKATLTAEDEMPEDNPIIYYLSVDGGDNWKQVAKGVEHTFSKSGGDLRWKTILSTSDTVIQSVSVNYVTKNTKGDISPMPPTNISITEWSDKWWTAIWSKIEFNGALKISWDNPTDSDFACINIYRSTVDGELGSLIKTISRRSYFIDVVGLDARANYYYTFRSVDFQGNESVNIDQYVSKADLMFRVNCKNCFPNGTLIKVFHDPKIYVIIDGRKKHISSPEIFKSYNYNWNNVVNVSQETLDEYPFIQFIKKENNNNKVYKLINGKKFWVPATEDFLNSQENSNWDAVAEINKIEFDYYPEAKLVKKNGSYSKVWYITKNGTKRHVPSVEVFDSYGYNWENIELVSPIEIKNYSDNNLIRAKGDTRVYKLENGWKQWIKTPEVFQRFGYKWDMIDVINKTEWSYYPEGNPIE